MVEANGEKRRIAYFSPDVTDVSTIKRADDFLDNGFEITVLGFRRARYNRDYRPRWSYFELGQTADGNYLGRLRALFLALGVIFGARTELRRADWFYARNIDQLLLALLARFLFRPGAGLVYEVLDVQPAFTGRTVRSTLFRLAERLALAQIDLLVVSSPGFVRHYFEPIQSYRGNWFLLENKLHPSALDEILPPPEKPAPPAHGDYKWVVSYVGLIRGEPTLALIERLATRFRNVLFEFHGILTTVNEERFAAALARNPNMIYRGEYVNPRDLARVYAGTDFVWALDLENAADNSSWLLPCRFYEAGLLGKPCLAARGFEIGDKVDQLGAGWSFAAPYEETLSAFFASVTREEYGERCRHLRALPASTFIGGEEAATLCRFLANEARELRRPHGAKGSRAHRLVSPAETEDAARPPMPRERPIYTPGGAGR